MYDVIVIGGGAAGIFAAIQLAEKNKGFRVLVIEKSNKLLEKVKISGGGRCNVTHACFESSKLIHYYPRGHQDLQQVFDKFMPQDMISWLNKHKVNTKIEDDGRIFPVSNDSQSIIDCFLFEVKKYKIQIINNAAIIDFYSDKNNWNVQTGNKQFETKNLLIASGSSRKIWDILAAKKHTIATPVPSLFTFKIKDALIKDLSGISLPNVTVNVQNETRCISGPLLITHHGLSGPAILKLSAWEAELLAQKNYQFELIVNWIGIAYTTLLAEFKQTRDKAPKTRFSTLNTQFNLPKRLWQCMLAAHQLDNRNFAESSNKNLEDLAKTLCACPFKVDGKNTNKDEFVTCGGVLLDEINLQTMESKLHKNLFFAGEVIHVDALTGGFNFQNAWSTAFVAAQNIT